jgi:serine/threonine protein kinase
MNQYQQISQRYLYLKEIGKGSFGEVWKIKRVSDGKLLVAKREKNKKEKKSSLRKESKIYIDLLRNNFGKGIPRYYEVVVTNSHHDMILELLGPSLDKLFKNSRKYFSINTTLFLGIGMIKLIQKMHNIGYLHRDIKPSNFVIGKDDPSEIYIMDFGLSKYYLTENGEHIKKQTGKSLVGTARYASINVHNGIEPSRRDDLISIIYTLIYFHMGSLPWQGLAIHKSKIDYMESIKEFKIKTSNKELCKSFPKCFETALTYCYNLKFTETPNYHYLINLFLKEFNKTKKASFCYPWVIIKK